ncbi:AraC family transcriptional regulator [Clostridium sp. MCC353]|uniref:AraC family transcriptional regulator n=1 Tax=Clostridium sp. MCC353 TaxID=2592646 RepID=UPI001C00C332|nr:AraC family transcriptional regulator [Clostridium sp. MCC353]MBT9775937.1 AraC family transcriptional regulator [Clostridium sp. MCC353]
MSENLLFSIFPNENFVDLGLYQYGWEQCDPLHSYGPYARNHYLFHYVISGTGTLLSNDSSGNTRTFQIKSGQGFMIFPKQINTYFADKERPWEYTWVEFDGLRVKEALELAGLTMDSPIYRSNAKDLSLELKNEMLYIAQHSGQSPFHLIGHLYLFLDYLTRSSSSRKMLQGGKIRDFYIREAVSFIEQHFQNDITIEDIAAFCNLNRSYFGKIFRDAVGKSPQEFLISYRMTKAAELLKLTGLSIGDIGNAVGYPSQLHFSRAFKKTYGVSPRQWRDENKIAEKK